MYAGLVVVSVVIVVCFFSLLYKNIKRRHQRIVDIPLCAGDTLQTIFVAVIVLPGEECSAAIMLNSMFETAVVSERVHVGVLHYVSEQGRKSDVIGLNSYFNNVRSQYDRICIENGTQRRPFKVIRRNAEDNQGRELSRAEIKSLLFANEKYWCEVHPMHRFMDRWDSHVIESINMAGPKTILSTEPGDIYTGLPTFPVVVQNKKDEHQFPQVESRTYAQLPTRPYESPLLSYSFVFAPSQAINDCPPDPRFTFCDTAEVLLRSVRFATHGYRFFTPHKVIVCRQRESPIDSDPHRKHTFTKAITVAARTAKINGINAVLSVLGEDLCDVCHQKRHEHVTSTTLNHPFEPTVMALPDRGELLGSEKTLKSFRKKAGCWVHRRPNKYAAHGILKKASKMEMEEKGINLMNADGNYA
jgi:hypothetical protein